jgi:hypothetical protein
LSIRVCCRSASFSLLLRQCLDAPRFGFVGLVLQGDIAGIDHRHEVAGLDLRPGARQNLGHPAGDFGADFRIGENFKRAQGFQRDLELALRGLGHGDQRWRRDSLLFLGFLAAAGEGGSVPGRQQGDDASGQDRFEGEEFRNLLAAADLVRGIPRRP